MYLNEEVLAELNLFGRTTKAYIYGNDRLAYDTGEDISYYLYDGRGSVSRIATEWGRIKETYTYDPYGQLTLGIPDSVNYYGYNGESANLATGLQYLRARYYNMENGSFLSEDSYLGTKSEPLSRNRYAYVSNNPVNYVDPSGHKLLDGLKKVGNAIGDFFGGIYDDYKRGMEIYQETKRKTEKDMQNLGKNIYDSAEKVVSDTGAKIHDVAQGIKQGISDGWESYCEGMEIYAAHQEEVGKAYVEIAKDFCDWTNDTFGAGVTTIVSERGDSSKSLSVYADGDIIHPIKSSSAGIKLNIMDFTLDIGVALDDIGIKGAISNRNKTQSFGIRLDITKLYINICKEIETKCLV